MGALAVAVNLVLFIAVADGIERFQIHHHWVLPTIAALTGLQLLLVHALRAKVPPAYFLAYQYAVLGILAAFSLIGSARHETIFLCYGHCGYKLALMHGLASLQFFYGAKISAGRRAILLFRVAALLFLVSAWACWWLAR